MAHGFFEYVQSFFDVLRENRLHEGLDPEFTAIEALAVAEPDKRRLRLRETIHFFFWGRGFQVLEKVMEEAPRPIRENLGTMKDVIAKMLAGQFSRFPPEEEVPQPKIVRKLLSLCFGGDTAAAETCIDRNIRILDGHFFMSISEAIWFVCQTVGPNGADNRPHPQIEMLCRIAQRAAARRREFGFPCSFDGLFDG